MRRQLALCGLRSISNVVDITNYVMLEIGQPMHAFDMSTLESSQIIVRRAENGEMIQTLDGKEFKLNREQSRDLRRQQTGSPCGYYGRHEQ